jgi:methionyl-tRNA formyltransferase
MKVFFIGAVHFSKRCLEELIRLKVEVVGVCTLSESPFNSDHFDLSSIAKEHSIPVRSSPDVGSEDTLKWIRGLEPDVIFCFGWSKMIPDSVLTLPPLGAIGFHPASLPQNRGRHPLIWALALGLSETASTFFFMDAGADSGDLLSQEPVPRRCSSLSTTREIFRPDAFRFSASSLIEACSETQAFRQLEDLPTISGAPREA